MKRLLFFCIFIATYSFHLQAQTIVRGPYLQKGSSNSITIKWRTDLPTQSKIEYGTSPDNLNNNVTDNSSNTNHEIQIDGLDPSMKYYYRIGNSNSILLAASNDLYFKTHPNIGTTQPISIWVLGDCGTGNTNARNVRDAYYNYIGNNHTDAILMLGDNAYADGTDEEYQDAVFEDMYEDKLKNSILWSCLGNHDGHTASSATESGPYYDIFTFPKSGESGGLASGTEAYYSFDYGNIHFISLDSYDSDTDVGGAMYVWAENDIQNTTQEWIVAFWHHPAYTKGSHDSDTEPRLEDMRNNFVPMLEKNGVDLVLSGHSHSYERSYFINGHYNVSGTFDTNTHTVGTNGNGDGRTDGDGAYTRTTNGNTQNDGAVYITAGSSGKTGGGSLDHPAMFYSVSELGSCIMEVDESRMNVKFLRENGNIEDYFTIEKEAINCSPGAPCDDGSPYTINDEYDNDCFCTGTVIGGSTCIRINSGADDVEENGNSGRIEKSSSDIELVYDGNNQMAGLRFNNVDVPQGAIITEAYIQFTVDELDSEETILTIHGEDTDNASPFTTSDYNLSNRTKTAASINWTPPAWDIEGASGTDQRTPDISSIIQQIVDRNGYSKNNSIALMISGSGQRTAESYNGEPSSSAQLCITYSININEVCQRISSGEDDVEEYANTGGVNISSSDLELIYDDKDQTVGLRFNDLNIPQGAVIQNAKVQFTADEKNSEATNLIIKGEDVDNALPFLTTDAYHLTNRTKTQASVTWNPAEWNTTGVAGPEQQTPDLSDILNEIVSRSGYNQNSSIALFITGTGKRVAESYNGDPDAAPQLCVTYSGTCSTAGQACNDGDPCTANDTYDDNCNCLGIFQDSDNDSICDANDQCPDFNDQLIGTSCDDGDSNTFNDVYTNNCICQGTSATGNEVCQQISSGADDAEENSNGAVQNSSSDIELVYDDNNQIAGLRFNDMDVPQGAIITEAYIQFTVDELNDEATNLTIHGEDTDNASPFTTSDYNLSNRTKTTASINWTPPAWTTQGDAGTDQRTPDISSIIQEIVNRNGYNENNSMALIISGSGQRTAESYEGDPSSAARLCITYSIDINEICQRISSGEDDVEEYANSGAINDSSSDLEMIYDDKDQAVGLRFNDLNIPQGAFITGAKIQFTADEKDSEATNLTIKGEDVDNASPFLLTDYELTNRTKTQASVTWNPPEWNTTEEAGTSQQTPDLSGILNEIISRSGYNQNSSIALFITGTGKRVADSYNGDPETAPQLCVTYTGGTNTEEKLVFQEDIPAMKLYPNPATNTLTVSLENINVEGQLHVVNSLGRILITKDVSGETGTSQLNVGRLPSGFYWLSLNLKSGQVLSQSFIKVE